MTRYLLDTNVFLWLQTEPMRLGRVLSELERPGCVIALSAVSTWEITIKWQLGKLPLPESPDRYVPDRMARSGIVGLSVTQEHALEIAALPLHHRDPFDRMLVSQARIENLTLITSDRGLAEHLVDVITV